MAASRWWERVRTHMRGWASQVSGLVARLWCWLSATGQRRLPSWSACLQTPAKMLLCAWSRARRDGGGTGTPCSVGGSRHTAPLSSSTFCGRWDSARKAVLRKPTTIEASQHLVREVEADATTNKGAGGGGIAASPFRPPTTRRRSTWGPRPR